MVRVLDMMVKDVIVISPKERVVDAAKKMKTTGVSSLIVTEGNEVRGIITRSDLIDRFVAEARDPAFTTVEDVMTKNAVTIRAKANILEALRLMKRHKYS